MFLAVRNILFLNSVDANLKLVGKTPPDIASAWDIGVEAGCSWGAAWGRRCLFFFFLGFGAGAGVCFLANRLLLLGAGVFFTLLCIVLF